MSIAPIEKEFFVLNIDVKNSNHRIYSEYLINDWIKNFQESDEELMIEYAIDLDEQTLKTEFVKETLHCGKIMNLRILVLEDGFKTLLAKAKFKIKGPFAEKMQEANFFDDLTLVPKGKGQVTEHIIHNYNLIGFNLINKELSPFITEIK